MTHLFMALAIGLCAGVASGFFGIGGGILIVPLLGLLLGYTQQTATATSMVALLLPVGLLGAWQYYQAGKIQPENIHAGLLIALGLFIGAYLGAKWALPLPQETLRKAFAVLLVAVAARLFFTR